MSFPPAPSTDLAKCHLPFLYSCVSFLGVLLLLGKWMCLPFASCLSFFSIRFFTYFRHQKRWLCVMRFVCKPLLRHEAIVTACNRHSRGTMTMPELHPNNAVYNRNKTENYLRNSVIEYFKPGVRCPFCGLPLWNSESIKISLLCRSYWDNKASEIMKQIFFMNLGMHFLYFKVVLKFSFYVKRSFNAI